MEIVNAKEQCYLLGLAYHFQTYTLKTIKKLPIKTINNKQKSSQPSVNSIMRKFIKRPSQITPHYLHSLINSCDALATILKSEFIPREQITLILYYLLELISFLIAETTIHLDVAKTDLLPKNFPILPVCTRSKPRPSSTTIIIQNSYYIMWLLQIHEKLMNTVACAPPKWDYKGWILTDGTSCTLIFTLPNIELYKKLIYYILPCCTWIFRKEVIKFLGQTFLP